MLDGDPISATLERLKSITKHRVGLIAIFRGKHPQVIVQRASELVRNGINAIEITLDSQDAFFTLSLLRASLPPDVLIGVGTVTDPASQLPLARSLGATFCLAPNNPENMIEVAEQLDMLAIPGASNIHQVEKLVHIGARAIKLFHTIHDWNYESLKNIRNKYPNECLIPVGGLGLSDVKNLAELGFELLGLGENLVGSDLKQDVIMDWSIQ